MSVLTYPISPENLAENGAKQIIAGLQLSYGSLSIILMIYIFVHLNGPKYKNSFYRLVQADLLINITCWLNSWISIRFLGLEFGLKFIKMLENFHAGSWNIFGFFVMFFFHMQFCSAVSMSIHRISSIKFFNSYEKFWSRYYLLVELIFIVYSSLTQISGQPTKLEVRNGTVWFSVDLEIWNLHGKKQATFSIIYFCLLFITGITVARTALKKLQGTGHEGVSRKMTKIAMTYGLVYSGILLWSIANMILILFPVITAEVLAVGGALLSVASDMMSLSLPYILLIFDTNIKKDIREILGSTQSSAVVSISR